MHITTTISGKGYRSAQIKNYDVVTAAGYIIVKGYHSSVVSDRRVNIFSNNPEEAERLAYALLHAASEMRAKR